MASGTLIADTQRDLALYSEIGFHIEPSVMSEDFCDRLICAASTFPAVLKGDFRTALQPHVREPIFLEALRHPAVTRIMRLFLGSAISGIQSQFFYGKPGTPGFQPHQDNRYVNAPRGAFASAWIALTDVGPRNGGLYIYPGTHREPLLEVEEVEAEETMLQDVNALRLRCVVPEQYVSRDVEIPKGGGIFFDGHTIHGSYENKSQTDRYALLLTYIRQGAPFIAGRYAKREEIPIN